MKGRIYTPSEIALIDELECWNCGRTIASPHEEVKLPKGWRRHPDFKAKHPRDPHAFLCPSCGIFAPKSP